MAFSAASTTDEVLRGIDLKGKVAVVTGSSAGLGTETVRALAKQQLDAIEEFNSVGSKRLEELTSAKTPKELLNTQTKMAAEMAKDLKSSTVRAIEVLTQGQKELKAFLEKNVKDFIEKTKS